MHKSHYEYKVNYIALNKILKHINNCIKNINTKLST